MNPERAWSARNANAASRRTVCLTALRAEAAAPAASLAGAVILPRRSLVLDQLREGTWVIGIPDRVHDLPGGREERARLGEQRVVALVDPAHAVTHRASVLAAPDGLAVGEPWQIDTARDR